MVCVVEAKYEYMYTNEVTIDAFGKIDAFGILAPPSSTTLARQRQRAAEKLFGPHKAPSGPQTLHCLENASTKLTRALICSHRTNCI